MGPGGAAPLIPPSRVPIGGTGRWRRASPVRRLSLLLLLACLALGSAGVAQHEAGTASDDAASAAPEPGSVPELRGEDALEDQAARFRSGLDTEGIEIGARCTTPGAELEIEGIGRAVYDRISVDTAEGSARLSGGVCIEVPEVDLIIRALYFEVTNLDGSLGDAEAAPRISALQAVLDMGGWRLSVGSLQGPIDGLDLRNIRLLAPGLVGAAALGRIEAAGEVFEASLEEVALATRRYHLDAGAARLAGDVLVLDDASGTTCVCEVERFRLSGTRVRVDLASGDVRILRPSLRVLGVGIPLGRELSLGGEGPRLEFPVALAGRDGLGSIAVVRGSPLPGVRVEVGAATEPIVAPLATLEVEVDGDRVSVAADGRGLLLDARRQRPLAGDLWAAGYSRIVLREDDPQLRNGAEIGWSGRRQDDLGGGVSATHALSLQAGAELAVEPAAVLPADPLGAGAGGSAALRLPVEADARTTLAFGPALRAGLRARLAAAAYPSAPEFGRAAFTLAPSLSAAGADAGMEVSLERRWTVGDGPFAFDAVEPRFRVLAEAAVGAGPFAADLRAAWRLPPEAAGADDLRLRAHVDLPLGGGWTLRPSVQGELAGLLGGPEEEDWLEAGVEASHGEDLRLGLRAREGVDPWELRDLVVSAQVPFEVNDVRFVPYLALDVAPSLAGAGPRLAGHGLRVYVDDCCGTVILGYRVEDGALTVELDMRLPPLDLAEPPLTGEALPSSMLDVLPDDAPPAPAAPPAPDAPAAPAAPDAPDAPSGPGGPVPRDPDDALDVRDGASRPPAPREARYGDAS